MGDALNPTGEAQPSLNQAYETKANPASKEPAEQRTAQSNATNNSAPTDQRIPSKQSSSIEEATPTSVAYGVRGAGEGEESKGLDHEDVGRNKELDAEQMAAPGEDKIASTVKGAQSGAGGREQGMETDLDRKKAEQAPLREQKKEEKAENFDVGGVLGQRGGPANPVDKNNYPNTDRH
ncbi:hypothetical protein BAUCODRAFT_76591 [Baudoinia panamericana UAMH 10762]|uniref:Uncharacterized protein n=1 Tax=Baudoinia panamericana (strain UAMH 10762) TaxID=717646 RepID=M2MQ12_BAUPA|nr:uncharacterized protein BAUCODRAFT_76591 [Baudoinia panamericana UAMH 10762]EMC93538.1 hypothetical protein BAUCODRAFT_76591 [Baudoinia panamericana UAMH 10762]